ncbi:protein RETICULATA-RELATED 4, chloroplastic-like isoform X1 [Juglans regia]|uniref:Protein RETICULATA-RELATED 4, chloroplastic-like isoform X1 n=1 Tax=Juglans regia TaxID=51240 RepID=A0A2I4HAP4_JUGRE|nr:protein RETICULATA-RELATED 4, chloroplastic-like isoform X1 [Juglans regia]XP_035541072.1 protein RETICULATA-RELATED 4, chloroplastic-like isoform X1 [Juglans regia]
MSNDLRAAVEAGSIPGSVIDRFLELEKSGLFCWLMQFGGFKERLLADDPFHAVVGIEYCVGMFTMIPCSFLFLPLLFLSDHHLQLVLEQLPSSSITALIMHSRLLLPEPQILFYRD